MPRKTLNWTNLDVCLKGLNEWRSTHRLCFDNVIIKQQLDIIHSRKDGHALWNEVQQMIWLFCWMHSKNVRYSSTSKCTCFLATYCVSVRNEFKVHVLPFNLHLLHSFLQTKLFTGSTTYLIKPKEKIYQLLTPQASDVGSIPRILLTHWGWDLINPAPWMGDILHAPMLHVNNKQIFTFLWTCEGCIPACYRGMLMVQALCQSQQLHSSAKTFKDLIRNHNR